LAILGPVSFVRRFLRAWGLWLLLAGAGWLTWRLLADHDLAALLAKAGTGEMSFGAGVDLVVAMPLSWLPLIADYTRFGRSPGGMFRGSAAGYLLANVWFMGLGAAYALAAGAARACCCRRWRPAAAGSPCC
jgi:NCS1 family nucleobase:cation symporter-1